MPTLLNIEAAPLPQIDHQPKLATVEDFDPQQHQGLLLSVDSEPTAPLPDVRLIAIDFPSFNDGRGLSLAVLLRSRHQYQGELRAIGQTHPDLLHYMRRCGFNSVLLPEPHNLEAANAAFNPYSDYYQASISNPEPAFRRMRRGA